jgi:hypothetical protein
MLHHLANQAKLEKEELAQITSWPELQFNAEDKSRLDTIKLFTEIMDTSIRIDIKASKKDQEDNVCIIPSQYILYAIKIKSFATNLYSYIEELELMRNDGDKHHLKSIIDNNNTDIDLFNHLDKYSKSLVLKPFTDKIERVGGKELINTPNGDIKIRSNPDFFGSIILKVLSIPDESSAIIGKVVYQLCENPEVYRYLERRFNHKLPFIRISKKIRFIAEAVFKYFWELDELKSFADIKSYTIENYNAASTPFNTSSIFKLSDSVLSQDDLISSGTLRYFVEPLAFIDETGLYVYLTTQWMNTEGDERKLNFEKLKSIFDDKYPDNIIIEEDGLYKLLVKPNRQDTSSTLTAEGASNVIYYGAPGTGKSHTINESIVEEYTVRTVFHADTQNSDFLGCLKPKMQGDAIKYEFRSGPFTNAIIKALQRPSEQHWLVIEEINRAPAAAVFGEIFQLLDREPSGDSTYSINLSDLDMIHHIEKETGKVLDQGMLKIPSNLSLFATMNSSDQAVMPLDTAFKRRWNFRYIPLDFDSSYTASGKACSNGVLHIQDETSIDEAPQEKRISWKDFATAINQILTENGIPEDKHLGPFFLSDNELTDENRNESLTGKLFMYLWDDVLRHGMSDIVFNSEINTYGQLTRHYQSKKPVFSTQFYSLVKDQLHPIEGDDIVTEDGNENE